jgi:hypothetical protein
MFQIIDRYKDSISGIIHGFDRIVFQGYIRPLMFPEGAMAFFDHKGILFKDTKPWVEAQTQKLVTRIEEMAINTT